MILRPRVDHIRAVDLFEQNNAHELVRKGHRRKGEQHVRALLYARVQPAGRADDKGHFRAFRGERFHFCGERLAGKPLPLHRQHDDEPAQAGQDIIALGTTQADYFHGTIPCTRHMTPEEIEGDYELETGKVIVEELQKRSIDPDSVPGVLVQSHGPFTWGSDGSNAVHNAVVLEECAKMNAISILVKNGTIQPMQQELLDKHFNRKHGPEAYYGQ